MKVKKNDKIVYKVNGVEKEGSVVEPLVVDVECGDLIEVKSFINDERIFIKEKDISMIIREDSSSLLINETYEKPNEKFVRVYYHNGQRMESVAPLRLFVRFFFDNEKKAFCMEINGAKNPYPFRKAYGINPNMIEKCLNELGWKKIKTNYFII